MHNMKLADKNIYSSEINKYEALLHHTGMAIGNGPIIIDIQTFTLKL